MTNLINSIISGAGLSKTYGLRDNNAGITSIACYLVRELELSSPV